MTIVVRMILVALLVWLLISLFEKLAPEVKKYLKRNRFGSAWQKLVTICGGDYERAGRLMQHEKKSNPGMSDDEACRRAIEHYQQDNR